MFREKKNLTLIKEQIMSTHKMRPVPPSLILSWFLEAGSGEEFPFEECCLEDKNLVGTHSF